MKIAIVGGSPSSEHLAPYNDPDWKIWVLGVRAIANKYPRFDTVFEIHENLVQEHKRAEVKCPNYVPDDYYERVAGLGKTVIVSEVFPIKAPHIKVFPYEAVKQLNDGELYLTSSCAYMMAAAILNGATEIALYGIDMAVDDDEYFYQRPCMEAWIGFARGRGIIVTIPEESPLGRSAELYGSKFHGDKNTAPFTEAEFTALADQHQKRVDEIACEIESLTRLMTAHDGSRQAFERMAKVARAVRAGTDIKSLTHTALLK